VRMPLTILCKLGYPLAVDSVKTNLHKIASTGRKIIIINIDKK